MHEKKTLRGRYKSEERNRETEKKKRNPPKVTMIKTYNGSVIGHPRALVAFKAGRLYCICAKPWDGRATGHLNALVTYRDGRLYRMCFNPDDGQATGSLA